MPEHYPFPFPPPWADAWGDDRYGLWAELNIASVVQRLRWITPGQFLMGSPEHEVSRDNNEGPQHQVTLTEGMWLSDTACTQALWQALVGDNPSCFKGDELPVEEVNWNDIQQFLEKLQNELPSNVRADLPTEAEWEYACRAGTITPFSFGENINTEQVNYDGNYPYNKALKGELRAETVPVKALAANVWGLYQMHGNVWEWCADGMRDYAADAVINPHGASGKESNDFAIRGGCWFYFAQDVRSAQRDQGPRVFRIKRLGFRFVLRSTGPAGAGG